VKELMHTIYINKYVISVHCSNMIYIFKCIYIRFDGDIA